MENFEKKKWGLIGNDIGMTGEGCKKRAKELNLRFNWILLFSLKLRFPCLRFGWNTSFVQHVSCIHQHSFQSYFQYEPTFSSDNSLSRLEVLRPNIRLVWKLGTFSGVKISVISRFRWEYCCSRACLERPGRYFMISLKISRILKCESITSKFSRQNEDCKEVGFVHPSTLQGVGTFWVSL